MNKLFFRVEHSKKNRISELYARRSDGKIFKVSCFNGKWEILEDRGCYGTFNAVLNDFCLMWFPIEPFNSMIQACHWLKENINRLL